MSPSAPAADALSGRPIIVVCSLLAIVQAVLLVLAGGGPTRAAGVFLAIVICQVAATRMRQRPKLVVVALASALIVINLGGHTTASLSVLHYRLWHATMFAAYASLWAATLLAMAFKRSRAAVPVVTLMLTVILIGFEATLDSSNGRAQWFGERLPHPRLNHYYASDTVAKSVYPDNARAYFSDDGGSSPWRLELHDKGSAATMEQRGGALRVAIERASRSAAYNVQLNHPGLQVEAGSRLSLTFRARADRQRPIAFGVSMAHDPWQGLGFYREVQVAQQWQEYSNEFVLASGDANARLHFDLGSDDASVDLDRIQLRRSSDGVLLAPRQVGARPTVTYRFNALGCRGPDYAVPRQPARIRILILILGDSYALGEGVHEADTVARRLENALNRRPRIGSVERYEVINCGVAGYATAHERAFYQVFGSLYEPDVVLLLMNPTDAALATDDEEAEKPRNDVYDQVFRTIRLARSVVRDRWQSIDFSSSADELTQLVLETHTTGTRFGVVLFRARPETRAWRELSATVSRALSGSNVPILDLGPSMLETHVADALTVHPNDRRPNDVAHAVAARELERFLDQTGLLTPRLTAPVFARSAQGADAGLEGRSPAFFAGTRAEDPAGRGRVLVIAHRGDSRRYPENTLEAIEAAFDLGADVVEVDVHVTRDGVPVVFHDDTLERTTNGVGRVMEHALAQLKALDAGAWKGPQFVGTRIPTLKEAVRLAESRERGLLLDMKVGGLAQQVADVYARVGAPAEHVIIGAWTRAQRIEFAMRMRGAHVLKTEAAPATWSAVTFTELAAQGLWGFEVGDEWPAGFVREAVRHRVPVIAYTVNDAQTMRRLVEMGVSAIETDDPALLLRLAKESGAR